MEKSSDEVGMRDVVAAVAGPKQWSDTRESWLARAARRAGISFRQTKALFYGEITDRTHRSALLMQIAAQQRAGDLATRFDEIARTLNAVDADFYGADAAALVDLARRLRGQDQP